MFEQALKNIDDVLWKEAGCTTEQGRADEAALEELKKSLLPQAFSGQL
jgi:hypothetical protein